MINNKIEDFGQKIGGAKKDLAQLSLEKIREITDTDLLSQPLSKSFPRPDFLKMFNEELIDEDTAIKLQYLYNQFGTKPHRPSALNRWVGNVLNIITIIGSILNYEELSEKGIELFASKEFLLFNEHMKFGKWIDGNYNPTPFAIKHNYYNNQELWVCKGDRIVSKGTLEECVEYIKNKTGANKPKKETQFSVYQFRTSKEYFITPKGKSGVVLKKGFTDSTEAFKFREENKEELEKIYNNLRTLPKERRDWNRPRVGTDYRSGKDIYPSQFNTTFPFRGVEFGNWVNQLERAACLNEAYDALRDLASIIGIDNNTISLDNQLALAFGARGSGNAMAHYESVKVVINLTKTKGAGSLAHEWFHALDNHIGRQNGEKLMFATDQAKNIIDENLRTAFTQLRLAISKSEFKTRSSECDAFRSKPYWGTMIEMTARAFEKYVICKLAENGHVNDYLANIRELEEYPRPEIYPYPTDEEIKVLAPYYDQLLSRIFVTQESLIVA